MEWIEITDLYWRILELYVWFSSSNEDYFPKEQKEVWCRIFSYLIHLNNSLHLCENVILIWMATRMWRWYIGMLLQGGMKCWGDENAIFLPFISFKYRYFQVFCSWPISTETQVQTQVSPCGIFTDEVALGQLFQFPLSLSFHNFSVYTHYQSSRWGNCTI